MAIGVNLLLLMYIILYKRRNLYYGTVSVIDKSAPKFVGVKNGDV